ncbi:hypothetical protein OHV10_25110 [Vibrio splendidus]|uniref:hypothetical protein n=1 Tax=Vibrio splendidus TaxID=29497 RepID=UPI0022361AFD|nr:hypothetical protein [Vibrio splendidus]MCW4447471.1 hypothetical protein [Vibrio splendidus]
MDEVLIDVNGAILKIINKLRLLLSNIADDEQSKHIKKSTQEYQSVLEEYSGFSSASKDSSKAEQTLKLVRSAQSLAIGITYLSKTLPTELIIEANQIIGLCVEVREAIQREVFAGPNSYRLNVEEQFLKFQEENNRYNKHIKSSLNENETRIDELNHKSDKLETSINEQLEKVNELYEKAVVDIDSKQDQIDKMLGHAAGRTISGDYESNSTEEKIIANRLRYSSLLCMAFIVSIVAYSFWETTQASFQWEQGIFRLVLAAILSVPAAYLARESAKHREQQYNHLQTSLDLKTLSPYIASLPEQEQHKIKAEVAQRLFSSKDFSRVSTDSYPLNTHELIMELLKKIDLKK